MSVNPNMAAPTYALQNVLPLQTIICSPPKAKIRSPAHLPSPNEEILRLPENAYGLSTLNDCYESLKRSKQGLAVNQNLEIASSPDRTAPLLIHGISFKYWNPDESASDTSDYDYELTNMHSEQTATDCRKSTIRAEIVHKSKFGQSISSPLTRETKTSLPNVGQFSLVYDYASSASPGSPLTARPSSRRNSFEADVFIDNSDVGNEKEDVVRTPLKKRASARQNGIFAMESSTPDKALSVQFISVSAHGTTGSMKPTALKQAHEVPIILSELAGRPTENIIKEKLHGGKRNGDGMIEDKPIENRQDPAPFAQNTVAVPSQPDVRPIADSLKALPQATALSVARQRSLSFRPPSNRVQARCAGPEEDMERLSLCLNSVRGLNIRPTASAYQLAAMVVLSPKSFQRSMRRS